MRVTSNENKIVSQSEFSFLVMGLRKSSWSKLPFYQNRTGTRFLFYMMNSLKTEGNELASTAVIDFASADAYRGSRNLYRSTLPAADFGSSETNSMRRGYL